MTVSPVITGLKERFNVAFQNATAGLLHNLPVIAEASTLLDAAGTAGEKLARSLIKSTKDDSDLTARMHQVLERMPAPEFSPLVKQLKQPPKASIETPLQTKEEIEFAMIEALKTVTDNKDLDSEVLKVAWVNIANMDSMDYIDVIIMLKKAVAPEFRDDITTDAFADTKTPAEAVAMIYKIVNPRSS